jgi:CBS domain-containing protein
MDILDTPIKEVMSPNLISVSPLVNAKVAIDIMMEHGLHILPVVSGSSGIGGVVTLHHLRRLLEKNALEMDRQGNIPVIPVREAMVYFVHKVKTDTTVREVIRLMDKHHVRAVPVMDDGQGVGMVTRGDILRYMIREPEAE